MSKQLDADPLELPAVSGTAPAKAPSAETTAHMNDLKTVVSELSNLEQVLISEDQPGALSGNSNSAIRTKVKLSGGQGYVLAYNYQGTSQTATFTWNTAPGTITVNAEGRTINASNNSFTDTFGPYQAHVYIIQNGGSGGTPPPLRLVFTNPANNATVSGTITEQSGAGVPKAHVTLINKATGVQKEADTDESGHYTITDVPPGSYPFVLIATSGAVSHSAPATLIVKAQAAGAPAVFHAGGCASTGSPLFLSALGLLFLLRKRRPAQAARAG